MLLQPLRDEAEGLTLLRHTHNKHPNKTLVQNTSEDTGPSSSKCSFHRPLSQSVGFCKIRIWNFCSGDKFYVNSYSSYHVMK